MLTAIPLAIPLAILSAIFLAIHLTHTHTLTHTHKHTYSHDGNGPRSIFPRPKRPNAGNNNNSNNINKWLSNYSCYLAINAAPPVTHTHTHTHTHTRLNQLAPTNRSKGKHQSIITGNQELIKSIPYSDSGVWKVKSSLKGSPFLGFF